MVLVRVLVLVVVPVAPVVILRQRTLPVVMVVVHVRVPGVAVARWQPSLLVLHWKLTSLAILSFDVVGKILCNLKLLLGLNGTS
mgnify:FL=1